MEMIVGATSPTETPSTLEVTIEANINHPIGITRLRVRNWSSGSFQQIGTYEIGFAEEVITTSGIDATDRVRGGDGRIELSVKHVVVATFTALGFDSFFDQVQVRVD